MFTMSRSCLAVKTTLRVCVVRVKAGKTDHRKNPSVY